MFVYFFLITLQVHVIGPEFIKKGQISSWDGSILLHYVILIFSLKYENLADKVYHGTLFLPDIEK